MSRPTFIFTLIVTMLILQHLKVTAQTSQFNYQVVIRNNQGQLQRNTSLTLRMKVNESSPQGRLVYQEIHAVKTNEDALARITIGAGSSNQEFHGINWLNREYWLTAERIDTTTNSYTTIQSVQLLTIPTILVAGSAYDIADPEKIKEIAQRVDPVTIQENLMYLSNGTYIELPNYLTNTNTLLIKGSITPVSCFGETNGAIDVAIEGGNPPFSIEWNTGANSPSIKNLRAGVYQVYITDSKGFTAFKKFTLKQPAPLELNVEVANASGIGKEDGKIFLKPKGGTRPYTYEWSNGASSPQLTDLAAGFYEVTVTSGGSCNVYKNIVVKEPIEISYRVKNTTCPYGSDGNIEINIAGGRPPYEIKWSNNAEARKIEDLQSGKYTVFVTDGFGATATKTISVLQPQPIDIQSRIKNLSGLRSKDGAIALKISGGTPPYSYKWSNGSEFPFIKDLASGSYTITITDQRNCDVSRTYNIYGRLVDHRDSTVYRTIEIGDKVWMADNLNYGKVITSDQKPRKNNEVEKYCYADEESNCFRYGALYTWREMMQYAKPDNSRRGSAQGICPPGWHIPTDKEWSMMVEELGGPEKAGKRMKAINLWRPEFADYFYPSGFNATPAGNLDISGQYYYFRNIATYWSSSLETDQNAWQRTLTNTGTGVYRNDSNIEYGFSVRCVFDE
ncbi:MAG: FISUMP domain-containing protein [Bacteroidales bacterium]